MTENSFAFRLKELLEHKKLTLQAVATALGLSRPAVHKWTRGGEIDYDNLRKLAAFLNVNWIWLRYGEEAQREAESSSAVPLPLPMTDVRRKYTAEIMDSEARMKLAQEAARIVTWEWNLITDAVTYSPNVESVYGWPIANNADFWKRAHPDDIPMMQRIYEDSLRTGEPHEFDFRILPPDGGIRWISSR
ncbi:helix-turn-helix domain-containing protein, partial [Cupriavidus basilensis]